MKSHLLPRGWEHALLAALIFVADEYRNKENKKWVHDHGRRPFGRLLEFLRRLLQARTQEPGDDVSVAV